MEAPIQALPVVVGAAAYAGRVRTLRTRAPERAPAARVQAWFWAGVVVLLAAPLLPDQERFWIHMVEHLLLGDIAPLLIVLGLTGPVLRPLLAAPGIGRLRVLAHPFVALPLWLLNLYVWHLSGPYEAALRHDALHAVAHLLFFSTGALMWAAVIEPLPGPAWFGSGWKAAYTLVVRVLGMVLANVLIWASHPFYPSYGTGVWDQRTGGLIMFTEGGIVTLVVFGVLFIGWTREAELRQQRIDAGLAPRPRPPRARARRPRSPSARGKHAG